MCQIYVNKYVGLSSFPTGGKTLPNKRIIFKSSFLHSHDLEELRPNRKPHVVYLRLSVLV